MGVGGLWYTEIRVVDVWFGLGFRGIPGPVGLRCCRAWDVEV